MKKVLKRSLSFLLAITIIFGSAYVGLSEVDFANVFAVKVKAVSSGTCGDNLTWTLDDEGTLTISGTGDMYDYYEHRGEYAPWRGVSAKIKSLVVCDGVTSIGCEAFLGCTYLTSITIPDSVKLIENRAFYNTGYYNDESNWDNGVLYIDSNLIEAKTSIYGDYAIKDGTRVIADCAFYDCTRLKSVVIPNSVISICDGGFYRCTGLTSITIPDGVRIIGNSAFCDCVNITSITLPDSITNIGYAAFYSTKYFSAINSLGDELYIGNYLISVKESISGEYVVKEGTKAIAGEAFYKCKNITSVILPDSVISIEDRTFASCSNLTSITIPDSVTSIGDSAFMYCTSLISITIPNSITSIGEMAFYNCTSLDYVFYGGTKDDKNEILVGADNSCLNTAFWHYESSDHVCGDWILDTKPICTSTGSQHKECTVCGEIVETVEIPATGHNYIDVVEVPATCTVPGKMVSTCQDCGDSYETPIVGEHRVGIATIDPTCDEAGKTGEFCLICAQFIGEVTEIPATGHTSSDWIFDEYVTCTTGGSKHKECTVCGEVLETVTYPATGHTTGHWIIDLQPTVSAQGSQHKECIDCGKVIETETIPMLKPATPKVTSTNALNGVQLNWNKVDGAVKYNIYRRQGGQSSFTYIGTTTGATFTDKNVKSGTYYVYSVRAYNSEGGYSAYISGNTSTRKYMATPKLTTIYNHQNGLAIKWNAVAGVTKGYRVYRRGAGSTYWTYLGTTKNLYFIDSAVKNKNGEYFRYTVIADGDYHSKFDTTGLYLRRLANPTLNSTVSSKSGITVKWGKVAGSSGYYVYRKTANSTWTRIAVVKGVNGLSYLDKTAKKGVTYTYTVRAVYGNTLSSYYSGISCKDKY